MKPSKATITTAAAANKAFKEFLQKHQTADKTKRMHTVFSGSILEVSGPFCIEDQDKGRFYELYTPSPKRKKLKLAK
jgi:hypothetical protein